VLQSSRESPALLILPRRELVIVTIIYHMPAHPVLLQEFLWQTTDYVPDLPRVHRFLNFWQREIEAAVRQVQVCCQSGELPLRHVDWIGSC
jgi:uncharacterized protein Usg